MSGTRRHTRRRLFLAVAANGASLTSIGFLLLSPDRAFAATKTFTNAAGGDAAGAVWSNPGNWDPNGIPGASDDVMIPNTLTTSGRALVDGFGYVANNIVGDGKFVRVEDYSNSSNVSLAFNSIAGGPNGVADFYIRGGIATVNSMSVRFSDIGQGFAAATFNTSGVLRLASGGTITTTGELIVGRLDFGTSHGVGTLDLGTNSTVNSYAIYVGAAGGVGTIVQNAGVNVNSANPLHVGTELLSEGNYIMNGGTLTTGADVNARYLFIGRSSSTGTFTMNDGTVYAGDMYLASDGNGSANFIMNGGTLSASAIYFGTSGTPTHSFVWNAGTIRNRADVDMALNSFTSTLEMQLAGAGTHRFVVDAGRYSTQYSAFFSGGGRLTKDGGGTLLLNGVNTHTGGTTISDGTLQVNIGAQLLGDVQNDAAFNAIADLNLGNIDGTGTTTLGDGVAAFNLTANHVRQGTLNVTGPSSVMINTNGGAAGTSKVGTLVLPSGATLNLKDNDLVVGAGTTKSAVESLVAAARNGGNWNLPGITSSTAAANASKTTGLGVISGAELNSAGGTGTFSGQGYVAGDTLVKYTWNGDANLDGRVTFDDYVKIDTGFNTGRTGWFNGDFNYSGAINFDDYVLIDIAFNQQNGTLGRAIDWISGDDRSALGLDQAGLGEVIAHFGQFGSSYGTAFLAAVPEPMSMGCAAFATSAVVLGGSRHRRGRKV